MRRCLLAVVILGFVALVQPANAAEPRVAFGAVPTVYHLVGGVIILAGVVYSQISSHAEKREH